jgi:polyisoprenoid-binding protein YceI
VSAGSSIEISGTSTVSDWIVISKQLSGEMRFAPSIKKGKVAEAQAGTIQQATVILEVVSIKSEKGETMDNKLYKALKSDLHPKITFVLTNLIQLSGASDAVSASGDVHLAGVTRPMTFDLKLTRTEQGFQVTGSRSLKLSDFAIEPPTAMFGQIETGNDIVVKLGLYFTK